MISIIPNKFIPIYVDFRYNLASLYIEGHGFGGLFRMCPEIATDKVLKKKKKRVQSPCYCNIENWGKGRTHFYNY